MSESVVPKLRKPTAKVTAARILILVLIGLNLWFIWYNSAKVSVASDKTSKRIAEEVAEVVVEDYPRLSKPVQNEHINKYNSKIRFLAHFAEFIPLGLLFCLLVLSLFDLKDRKRIYRVTFCLCVSLILSAATGLGDELHQLSVKGRTFQAIDILCDTLGALCGCVAALGASLLIQRTTRTDK